MLKKTDIQTVHYTARAMKVYGLFVLACTFLILVMQPNNQTMHNYNLTPEGYHVLAFSLSLPSIILWSTNFFAYGKLYEYAASIKGSAEYVDFSRLALGVKWLAWSFPIATSIAFIFDPLAYEHQELLNPIIIISNYVRIILPIVSFSIIGAGSRGLIDRANIRFSTTYTRVLVLAFVFFAALYSFATFRHFGHIEINSTNNLYHLRTWLAILTVVVPFFYTVVIGLLAAFEIDTYSNHVRGLLYKHSFRLMVGGLITVIVSSIIIEYIYLKFPLIGRVILDYRLFIVLLLRVVNAAGFIMIIFGVIRLKKLEEV